MRNNPFAARRGLRVKAEPYTPPASIVTSDAAAYLKQVYALLAASLLFSVATGYTAMGLPFAYEYRFLFSLASFGAIFLVMMKPSTPTLFLFTGLMGFSVGPIVGLYIGAGMAHIVGQAVAMTGAATLGLSFYALTTKRDLSFMRGMLIAGLVVIIVGMLVNIFMKSTAVAFAMSAMGAVIFSGFILFDTQQFKENPWMMPPAAAAASLFINIINLFLSLLQILGIMGGDE